jgi:hypothetical protein
MIKKKYKTKMLSIQYLIMITNDHISGLFLYNSVFLSLFHNVPYLKKVCPESLKRTVITLLHGSNVVVCPEDCQLDNKNAK